MMTNLRERALRRAPPPVRREERPVDVGGLVAGQPRDRRGDLIGLGGPRRHGGLIARASEILGQDVEWTFGGGTVLMLDLHHRRSKDIDVFLPHAQALGLFNPRLSDDALTVTADYDESAGHIKLFLPQGEIDFVVAEPLTANPFHRRAVLGHDVLLERPAEIIAKKFWHRGPARRLPDLPLDPLYGRDSGGLVAPGPPRREGPTAIRRGACGRAGGTPPRIAQPERRNRGERPGRREPALIASA
ncbi:MAG: nucleotidyl transferase AbiEii/AbiGii toxin family protein [Actinomycetota bacterium]